MQPQRQRLPSYKMRTAAIEVIERSGVVVSWPQQPTALAASGAECTRYFSFVPIRPLPPLPCLTHSYPRAVGLNGTQVVSGETGCGKTTQVPQFVLDHAIEGNSGAECSIICTQPRRISAIGVAERVAAERG